MFIGGDKSFTGTCDGIGTLLRKVNGSSSFYKGPRTLLVLGPLQKLLLPLTFCSNVPIPSHVPVKYLSPPINMMNYLTVSTVLQIIITINNA